MEVLLLGIYSFVVWLIFIKLKWLPWNTKSQVTVALIPIVGMAALILALNVVAPSSSDVRVFKYTIPIVSQVKGRVIEVPLVEGNVLVRKDDVLFRVDPTPYQLQVNTLEAQLANAQASQRELEESTRGAQAKIAEARGAIAQATSRIREASAKLDLARKRAGQYSELAGSGAGSTFDVEKAQNDIAELQAQLAGARSAEAQARSAQAQAVASERQIQQKLGARAKDEYAPIAQIRAQLENAEWELGQTTVRSPCDCYVINLQLRPGAFVAGLPFNPVMTLVEADGQVVALYHQNELYRVAPGNEAEFALETIPGRVIKATVDSIVWAQGLGQLPASGTIPMTGFAAVPPGRYAVKFNIGERDRETFLAAGAAGQAAIYTDHLHAIHIIRKVILRVGSYVNYLILKLH